MWIWVNSGFGNGALRFMGLQRVGHDWATELNWTDVVPKLFWNSVWINPKVTFYPKFFINNDTINFTIMNCICKNLQVSYMSQWFYWTKCWDGHLTTGVLLSLNSAVVKEVTLLLDPECRWEAAFLWYSSGSEDVSVCLGCCDKMHVTVWFMKNRSFSQFWMLRVWGQEVSQTGSVSARFRAADFLLCVVSHGGGQMVSLGALS